MTSGFGENLRCLSFSGKPGSFRRPIGRLGQAISAVAAEASSPPLVPDAPRPPRRIERRNPRRFPRARQSRRYSRARMRRLTRVQAWVTLSGRQRNLPPLRADLSQAQTHVAVSILSQSARSRRPLPCPGRPSPRCRPVRSGPAYSLSVRARNEWRLRLRLCVLPTDEKLFGPRACVRPHDRIHVVLLPFPAFSAWRHSATQRSLLRRAATAPVDCSDCGTPCLAQAPTPCAWRRRGRFILLDKKSIDQSSQMSPSKP